MDGRVQPPLFERELADMFMGTLQGLYYDKMVGSITSRFSDLVTIGERIETGLKSGKISGGRQAPLTIQKDRLRNSQEGKREKSTLWPYNKGPHNHW